MGSVTTCTDITTGSLITEHSTRKESHEPEYVISSIGYLKNLDLYETEKPYYSNVPLPNGRQSNIVSSRYPNITLTNIRPNLSDYNLDKQGFEVVKYDGEAFSSEDFSSDSWIERNYYPIIEEVLLKRFGKVIVKIFDHTVRRRDPATSLFLAGEHLKRQPSMAAHVDQTFLSGVNRIKLHMGSEAAALLKGRCQIINVWRPLFEPLEDYPLAFCDYHSVDVGVDCVASDLVFPHYIGEQYHMLYSPQHKWHFLNRQRVSEMILLKCYESLEDGTARFAAHTSFQNPLCPSHARLRESIEVRCIVAENP